MGRVCNTNGAEEEYIFDIDVEVRRKETFRKTKT
jgi:hypothetical protein